MHDVVGEILFLHGAEGAEADVQQHFGDLHPHGADLVEQLPREMQPRRRRGGGTVRLAVDGLVAGLILQLFVDIRGEWHGADAG